MPLRYHRWGEPASGNARAAGNVPADAWQLPSRSLAPMPRSHGRRIAISAPRRFMGDLLHFSKKVPSVPMQRRMNLAPLVAARRALRQRVGWGVLFLKAYALVSAERAELRRSYLQWPWPHFYEHTYNVASLAVEREYQGESCVFYAKIARPEIRRLTELEAAVGYHKSAPIEAIASFRHALRLGSLPWPLRRLAWRGGLNLSGAHRGRMFGTFGMSVVAARGAAGLHLLSPLTTTLNYGPFDADGCLDVRLVYDHRVLDGGCVALALAALERTLLGSILHELEGLADAVSYAPVG